MSQEVLTPEQEKAVEEWMVYYETQVLFASSDTTVEDLLGRTPHPAWRNLRQEADAIHKSIEEFAAKTPGEHTNVMDELLLKEIAIERMFFVRVMYGSND